MWSPLFGRCGLLRRFRLHPPGVEAVDGSGLTLPGGSGAPALSLSIEERQDHPSQPGVDPRHHLPAQISQPGSGYNPLSGQLLWGDPNASSLTSCQWTSSPALCWVSPGSPFALAMTALAVQPAVYSEGFEGQGIWGRLI